jgi:hypothetical protein
MAAEPAQTAQIREQLVKRLASIKMKLNLAVDEKFCRQFLEDFRRQNRHIEHVQPTIQADRIADPVLASFLAKCPTVKWIGADADEPGYRLNTQEFRHQVLAPTLVGTAHFRLYHVDIDNNKVNGKEHVFYSDEFVPEPPPGEELPPVDELSKTMGDYTAVSIENCAALGGVVVGNGSGVGVAAYNGIIRYHGRLYIYDLYTIGGLKLNLQEYTTRRKNFVVTCRYWQ